MKEHYPIHLPPCQMPEPDCVNFFNLKNALERRDLRVYTDYPPYGRHSEHFVNALDKCEATIIHICPMMLKRVHLVRTELEQSKNCKIFIVLLSEDYAQLLNQEAESNMFFDFTCHKSFSSQQLNIFVKNVVLSLCGSFPEPSDLILSTDEFPNSHNRSLKEPESSETEPLSSGIFSSCSEQTRNLEKSEELCLDNLTVADTVRDSEDIDEFIYESGVKEQEHSLEEKPFRNIFGLDLKIKARCSKRFLDYIPPSREDCDFKTFFAKLFEEKDNDFQINTYVKYLAFEMLPGFIDKEPEHMFVLAAVIHRCVSLSRQTQESKSLLYRSLSLLELGLFALRTDTLDKHTVRTLLNLELWVCLALSRSEIIDEVEKAAVNKRLVVVHALTLCHLFNSGQKDKSITKICLVQLGTIINRSPEMETKSFAEDLKKYLFYYKTSKTVDGLTIYKIFLLLQKGFQDLDEKSLEEIKSLDLIGKKKFQKACNQEIAKDMISVGLLHLFLHESKRKTDKKLTTVLDSAFSKLTEMLPNSDNSSDFLSKHQLKPLFYKLACDEKTWQRGTAADRKRWEQLILKHDTEILRHSLKEIVYPLLQIDEQTKRETDAADKNTVEWLVFKGMFDIKNPCIAHVRKTLESKNSEPRKDHLSPKNLKLTELRMLKLLRHENIMELFAYSEEGRVQFYITPDYGPNVQEYLTYKRQAKDFLDPSKIFSILAGAFQALKYCHSKNIIHRNLTAKSLFLSGSTNTGASNVSFQDVKLAGFELACPLSSTKDPHNDQIPLLWSAPESHQDGKFSKQSDVWMAGHLMYEVVTHGLQPYHDTDRMEQNMLKYLMRENIRLKDECMTPFAYETILKCTHLEPDNRCQLDEIIECIKAPECFPTTDPYKESEGKTSLGFNVGSIDSPDAGKEDYETQTLDWDENIKLKTVGSEYVFTEKCRYDVMTELYQTLEEPPRDLEAVLPRIERGRRRKEMNYLDCRLTSESPPQKLHHVIRERKLGHDLEPYLTVFLEVARTVKLLHLHNIFLGHLSPSALCLLISQTQTKTFVVSYSHLTDGKTKIELSEMEVWIRAAPEVMKDGNYNEKSDVYSLGLLLWEILHLLNKPETDDYYDPNSNTRPFQSLLSDNKLTSSNTKDQEKIILEQRENVFQAKRIKSEWEQHLTKPDCCSMNLYNFLKECFNVNAKERPKLDYILEKFDKDMSSFVNPPVEPPISLAVTDSSTGPPSAPSTHIYHEIDEEDDL